MPAEPHSIHHLKTVLKYISGDTQVPSRTAAPMQHCAHLGGDAAAAAAVMHEDSQHVRDELGKVELELPTQGHHDLLNEEDNGALYRVVHNPEVLEGERRVRGGDTLKNTKLKNA